MKLAAYPVNQGSAVACAARRQPNRLRSIKLGNLSQPSGLHGANYRQLPLPATIGHLGESKKQKANLPRVVARTHTVYAPPSRPEPRRVPNTQFTNREFSAECRNNLPSPSQRQMCLDSRALSKTTKSKKFMTAH